MCQQCESSDASAVFGEDGLTWAKTMVERMVVNLRLGMTPEHGGLTADESIRRTVATFQQMSPSECPAALARRYHSLAQVAAMALVQLAQNPVDLEGITL